jgi:hypothetical protein
LRFYFLWHTHAGIIIVVFKVVDVLFTNLTFHASCSLKDWLLYDDERRNVTPADCKMAGALTSTCWPAPLALVISEGGTPIHPSYILLLSTPSSRTVRACHLRDGYRERHRTHQEPPIGPVVQLELPGRYYEPYADNIFTNADRE